MVLSFETPPKTGKKISYKDCYLKFNPKLKKLIEQNGVYLKIQEIDNDKKMKIAEKREKVKLILKQNIKIVYTKGFVIFYYWATSLEISNLKEITPVKDIYSTIEPTIRKKLTILQHCCECSSYVEIIPTGRKDRDRIINGEYLCSECKEAIRKKEEDEIRQKKELELIHIKEIQKLKYMPYNDYLLTEHWQITRHKALKRAKYKCELCNNSENLNVHHKTYENRGNEKPEDLIVLCKKCHSRFHDKLCS